MGKSNPRSRRAPDGRRTSDDPDEIALGRLIGARLRAVRELEGMHQYNLADKTGIGHSQISEYESGSRVPTVNRLRMLAVALNTSLDYLVGHTPK